MPPFVIFLIAFLSVLLICALAAVTWFVRAELRAPAGGVKQGRFQPEKLPQFFVEFEAEKRVSRHWWTLYTASEQQVKQLQVFLREARNRVIKAGDPTAFDFQLGKVASPETTRIELSTATEELLETTSATKPSEHTLPSY